MTELRWPMLCSASRFIITVKSVRSSIERTYKQALILPTEHAEVSGKTTCEAMTMTLCRTPYEDFLAKFTGTSWMSI